MYKLLISDFENTLIDIEDAIPLSTMLALDKVRNSGVSYCVITNKSFKSVLDYNKDFPFMDYIIASNGAYVYDVNNGKALIDKNIPISIVKKIKKVFDDYNLCFYTLDWCNYTKDIVREDNVRKIGDFKVFSSFHKNSIYKIEIYCSSKKEQTTILNELKELELDLNYSTHNNDKGYYIEIVMDGCSRLDAINTICKMEKIELDDVIMIGYNDDNVSVFKKIGLSYAVDNSSSKIKKSACEVTVSNYDKAVETVIESCFK